MSWQERREVIKGNIGEHLVEGWLIEKGYVPYRPVAEVAHPFDRLCATRDKRSVFVAEVKAKPRRYAYPDTGIDIRHYEDYRRLSKKHAIPIFLFFVDEIEAQIYGNRLDALDREYTVYEEQRRLIYPMRQRGIIYFPLEIMKTVAILSADQAAELASLSRSKTHQRHQSGQ